MHNFETLLGHKHFLYYSIIMVWSNQEESDGRGMWRECGRGGSDERKPHLQDLGVDWRIKSWRLLTKSDWIDVAQDTDSWGGSFECCNELSDSIKRG